jgi:hypothetical protein
MTRWIIAALLTAGAAGNTGAQHVHGGHDAHVPAQAGAVHDMWMTSLGGGWRAMGMAQLFPMVTIGAPDLSDSPLARTGWYLNQPVIMANIESPASRFALRTTLNFEGVSQPDGELSFGGWGEGFIDARHPHTLLHEFMVSANFRQGERRSFSLSAGRGFAPYGTDDPMSRPVTKYPTNHHLSQILERWTLNGVAVLGGWSLEAGVFAGREPTGPYDFAGIDAFGDSYAARLAFRPGAGRAPSPPWEFSVSAGSVREVHHDEAVRTTLVNAAIRHERAVARDGRLYALVEASRAEDDDGESYFALLGEAQLRAGPHRPYARVELATRPEYDREGAPGTDGFFRYDHDDHAHGATRWLITSVGYGFEATRLPVSVRPFIEAQHHRVSRERGGEEFEPDALFGGRSFLSLSAGLRIFFGGGPMRMGAYGVLDPMTLMHAEAAAHPAQAAPQPPLHQHR